MSLTSMLNGKKEIDIELQTILREVIPNKKQFHTFSETEAFSSKANIVAPYNLKIPYHSSVVGTAFDYMARFIVAQKIYSNKEEVLAKLTAKNGLNIAKGYCDQKTAKSLQAKFNKGMNLVQKFIYDEDIHYIELLRSASYMARLEHIYRSSMPPKDIRESLLGREEKEIIEDLKRLCEVFIERFMISQVITAKSNVVFNPHFGIASMRCGGADADLYIDGTLYDFKTTKRMGFNWKDVAQIFGYYFLNCIATDLKDKNAKLNGYEIKRLALYKARYGEIEFIDISSMKSEDIQLTAEKISYLLIPTKELPKESEEYTRSSRRGKNNLFKKIVSLLGWKI